MKKQRIATILGTWLITGAVSLQAGVILNEWNFNSDGDTEGWTAAGAHVSGLTTSGGVMTAADITGNDPIVVYNPDISFTGGGNSIWDEIIIRVRQLDSNGGSSQPWVSTGTLAVFNSGALNLGAIPATSGGNWTIVSEADNWITASASIASLGTADITVIRIDPLGQDPDANFEVDFVQLTGSVPEPGSLALVGMGFGFVGLLRKSRTLKM